MNTKHKILIVEDEAIIARDIQLQLTNSGFAVTGIAATASDAFREIEQSAPDLVLMDIRIRGDMDGVAAAGIIRDRYALPVIYLTAHADDTTLERAQLTEPFGYIVKPLGNANIKAITTMALHKHGIERELQNHRKMLSTILQGLADAIVVADPSGQVLFLNQAAEELTGWKHDDVAGKSFLDVIPLEDETGRAVSDELLRQSMAQAGAIRIPRNTALLTKSRGPVEVSGQLSIAADGNRAAGVFISLQDVSVQKREEQRLSQEQQLFTAGELARGVAQEFYGLFDLIDDCVGQSTEAGPAPDVDLVKRASQIGRSMSLQLLDFREAQGTAHAIDVSQHLLGSQSLLKRFCGGSLEIEITCAPNVGYVLSTGSHFEQLLMHLTLDGKQRVGAHGKLTISADVHSQAVSSSRHRSYVRLSVRSHRAAEEEVVANAGGTFPFDSDYPDLNLPIVRAIVTASGGFTRLSEPSEPVAVVEIFLPRQESRITAGAAANEFQRVILGVGLQRRLLESVQSAAGENALVLEAAGLDEAGLIAELYPSTIDLIILNDSDDLPKSRARICDRIRARRPNTGFIHVSSPGDHSGRDALNPGELTQEIDRFFNRRMLLAGIPQL